jgi:diguanylate cyclase (GGDEF)-like protein/PAS domain S-box-containing protein
MFSIFVLMGMGVVYASFPFDGKLPSWVRKVIMGLILSGVGITLMGSSYNYSSGIFYDARSVVMSVAGMFLGLIPTLIAMVGMVITRIIFGGAGTIAGSLSIIFSGAVGLLWRWKRLKPEQEIEHQFAWWELYIVGIVTSVVVILSQFALPEVVFRNVLQDVALPLLVIYPIGQVAISYMMLIQRNQFFIRRRVFESQEMYRSLFVDSDAMQFIVNPLEAKVLAVNKSVINKYGYTEEELTAMHVWDFDIADKDTIQRNFEAILNEEKQIFNVQQRTKHGNVLYLETHITTIQQHEETLLHILAFDKTKEYNQTLLLEEMDDKFRTMLLSIGEGVIVVDQDGIIALMNHTAKTLLNIDKTVINERFDHILRIYSKDQNKTIKDTLQKVLMTGESYRSDTSYILMKGDQKTYIDFTIAPILSEESTINKGAIIVLRDISLEHRQHEEIRYISQHDHLTGLYNRYFFETELHRLDTKRQLPLSIIMGDVNGLKLMNDAFTHQKGDQMLQKISRVLEIATRHEDVVCRWGGDEFAILLPQTTEAQASIIINRIKQKLQSTSFHVIQPSLSLGVATKTKEEQPIYSIIKTAEEHMYREKLQEGKSMRNSLITTLESTLYETSSETKEHADNMIDLSRKMAKKLKFNQDQINTITLIARLHDIGKITIKDTILLKEGPLTKEEWDEIKRHPETGSRLVQSIPELNHISEGILSHHERYDGTGYPQGLVGEEIPLFSRIISIVDAYEVMTNGRVYRAALPENDALEELKRCAGTQFDPTLVEVFLDIIQG